MKRLESTRDDINVTVQQALKLGMASGTYLQIEYQYGFERFGSYETWAGGWVVTDPRIDTKYGNPIKVEDRI